MHRTNRVLVDSPNNVVVRHVGNNKLSERRLGIFTQIELNSTELDSTFESSVVFNYFSWLKWELSSAHVKFDVWTGLNFQFEDDKEIPIMAITTSPLLWLQSRHYLNLPFAVRPLLFILLCEQSPKYGVAKMHYVCFRELEHNKTLLSKWMRDEQTPKDVYGEAMWWRDTIFIKLIKSWSSHVESLLD